jgi:uncharacterized protein YprB with RNaseH-like and TPR domain
MQIDAQVFLRLVEQAGTIGFIDIEALGLRGDYNSAICVSIKRYDGEPYTFAIKQAGNDKRVVREAKEALESLDCWVTYYGKGFDIKFLNTRLLKWAMEPIEKRHHLDMYYTLKSHLLTARRSQGHLCSWLGTPEQKMGVSANAWSEAPFRLAEHLPTLIERCESDVVGLEDLYKQTKHLVLEIKK